MGNGRAGRSRSEKVCVRCVLGANNARAWRPRAEANARAKLSQSEKVSAQGVFGKPRGTISGRNRKQARGIRVAKQMHARGAFSGRLQSEQVRARGVLER